MISQVYRPLKTLIDAIFATTFGVLFLPGDTFLTIFELKWFFSSLELINGSYDHFNHDDAILSLN